MILSFTNFLLPLLITFFSTNFALPFLKKFFKAKPTERGMHYFTKPTGGGIIFAITYYIFALKERTFISLFSLPLLIIGLLDDKFHISSRIRFLTQLIIVSIILVLAVYNDSSFISNKSLIHNFANLFIIFAGVAIINFINFMDGIDGLVTGSFIVIFLVISNGSVDLVCLAGALSGFIFYNWQPSKIFMGDAGSLFIGSILIRAMINSETPIDFVKILFLITPLIADPAITLIRRIIKRKTFWTAHKLHLYQRLVMAGISHSRVSLIYITTIFLLSIFYLFSNLLGLSLMSFLVILFGIFIDNKFAANFNEN